MDRGNATRSVEGLRLHEQAPLVPDMKPAEWRAFVADVTERGILDPIDVTAEDVVLDGRHRLRAARELSLTEVPVRVVSTPDEAGHMLRAALHRRHFTPSQRAAAVVLLAEHEEARAAAGRRQRANLRPEVATLPPRGKTRAAAARVARVGERTVQDAQTVRDADPALFERVLAGDLAANAAANRVRRSRRLASLAPAPPLPDGRFDVIYADPPWPSENPDSNWAAERHYETMSVAEIAALRAPAADHAVLFLWAVNPLLPEALAVIDGWDFTYKANLAWVKPSIGLGFWTRNRHELLLVGVRGDVAVPDPADRPDSVIEARRGRHSQKPIDAYERIERMYPQARRLELFARATRPGWSAWGNEVAA